MIAQVVLTRLAFLNFWDIWAVCLGAELWGVEALMVGRLLLRCLVLRRTDHRIALIYLLGAGGLASIWGHGDLLRFWYLYADVWLLSVDIITLVGVGTWTLHHDPRWIARMPWVLLRQFWRSIDRARRSLSNRRSIIHINVAAFVCSGLKLCIALAVRQIGRFCLLVRLNAARFGALKARLHHLHLMLPYRLIWSLGLRVANFSPPLLTQHESVLREVCKSLLAIDVFRIRVTAWVSIRSRCSVPRSRASSILTWFDRRWVVRWFSVRVHLWPDLWRLSLTSRTSHLMTVRHCFLMHDCRPLVHGLGGLAHVCSSSTLSPILACLHFCKLFKFWLIFRDYITLFSLSKRHLVWI